MDCNIQSNTNFSTRIWPFLAGAVLSLALSLVACGGGGNADSGTSNDISLSPSGAASAPTGDTPDPHTASFETLRAAYDQLPHTSPESDAEALLAAAQGLADVSASGIEVAGNVWMTFNDGIPAVITTKPMPDNDTNSGLAPVTAQSTLEHALDTKLPGSKQAFLVEATGFQQPLYGHRLIAPYLTNQGFKVSFIEGQVGPEEFRKIRDASVLGLSTHGGIGVVDGKPTFIMSSGLDATVQNLFAYRAELQKHEMGFIIIATPTPRVPLAPLPLGNYWASKMFITPKFVRNNMTFANGSVVFMGVCDSFSTISKDMRKAFLDAGASVVLGWDDEIVSGYTAGSEAFFFDRLLSANGYKFYKIDPGNRPFPVQDVLTDMETRQRVSTTFPDGYPTGDARTLAAGANRYQQGAGVAHLRAQFATGYEGMSLVPSITGLSVDNVLDQLTLSGNFGDGPGMGGSRTVTLAGNVLNVLNWSSATIVANMVPREGPGSAGKLVVNVDGATSNPAWINQWNSVVVRNYTPADGRLGDGAGTATTSLQCTVNLRGSSARFRASPNGPPVLSATTGEAVVGTGDCMWDAYGTDDRATYTNTYAIAGTKGLPWVVPPQRAFAPSFARYAWVSASIDAGRASFQMLGGVNRSDGGGLSQTVRLKSNGAVAQSISPFSSSGSTDNVTAGVFGDDDSLQAGSAQQTLNFLTWSGSTSLNLPDPANYAR